MGSYLIINWKIMHYLIIKSRFGSKLLWQPASQEQELSASVRRPLRRGAAPSVGFWLTFCIIYNSRFGSKLLAARLPRIALYPDKELLGSLVGPYDRKKKATPPPQKRRSPTTKSLSVCREGGAAGAQKGGPALQTAV